MKRGWIALTMFILSLLLGGFEYLYVNSTTEMYLKMLDDADEKMVKNQTADAGSVAERLDHRFQNDAALLSVFMYHSEVNDVGYHLAKMRRYAQTGDVEEFLASSAVAKREILDIKDSKTLKWENVF